MADKILPLSYRVGLRTKLPGGLSDRIEIIDDSLNQRWWTRFWNWFRDAGVLVPCSFLITAGRKRSLFECAGEGTIKTSNQSGSTGVCAHG
jgi:hypothetical protein